MKDLVRLLSISGSSCTVDPVGVNGHTQHDHTPTHRVGGACQEAPPPTLNHGGEQERGISPWVWLVH